MNIEKLKEKCNFLIKQYEEDNSNKKVQIDRWLKEIKEKEIMITGLNLSIKDINNEIDILKNIINLQDGVIKEFSNIAVMDSYEE